MSSSDAKPDERFQPQNRQEVDNEVKSKHYPNSKEYRRQQTPETRFRELVESFRLATRRVGRLVELKESGGIIQAARDKRDAFKKELDEFIQERGRKHAEEHGEEEGRQHEKDYKARASHYHTYGHFDGEF